MGRIFLIAVAIDVVYQIVELRAFYPIEALLVAIVLGFFPYVMARESAARLARLWMRRA